MGRGAVLGALVLLAAACGGSSSGSPATTARHGSPSASSGPTTTVLSGSYGLLLAGANLQAIKPDGGVAASVPVAPSSVQFCSSNQDGAMQPPPVSATTDHIYFRDGDTKIRMVVPPSTAVDVTTVPGSATVVSFFSVSPDDQRIAVLVEDVSSGTGISLRLYVEDLHGAGNHADIYTTVIPKDKRGFTLWPMGWHQGALVLAVVQACTFEPIGVLPSEWHVSSATNAARIATIRNNNSNCFFAFWPSPAGVACTDGTGVTTIYDWAGKVVTVVGAGVAGFEASISGVSPAGHSVFFSSRPGIGGPPPATRLIQLGPGPYATVQGHSACLWIDENHLLAPDAVIQVPAETPGNVQVTANVTPLVPAGSCAGRFPGGL